MVAGWARIFSIRLGFWERYAPRFSSCSASSSRSSKKGETNMRDPSDIWTGKATSYNRVRPTPPPALLDLLTQLIGMPHPALVVDLGSGTGLSTAIWGERAERVIGIEPNADMRKEATHRSEEHTSALQSPDHLVCRLLFEKKKFLLAPF